MIFVTVLLSFTICFYPTAAKGCWVIVFTHGVRVGGPVAGKVCPCCISETVWCRKLILGTKLVGTLARGCRCVASYLTFNLTGVTLNLKFCTLSHEMFAREICSFLPDGLLGYCFHPWCLDGRAAGKNLSVLYLRNRKV